MSYHDPRHWPPAPSRRLARDGEHELHAIDCPCRWCEAPAARTPRRLGADAIGGFALSGLATGLALAWILDALTDGPGLGVMLGW